MNIVRQLRGHARIVFTPTAVVILGIVVLAIAFRARNASALLNVDGETSVRVTIGAALRIAVLQMSTLAGMVVAAVGASTLAGFLSSRRGEQFAALLEPRAGRRWALRYLAVALLVACGAVLTALATLGAGVLQALRLDRSVELSLGEWRAVSDVVIHAALPVATFAAIAVLLASLLRGSPAVAGAAAVGGTQAMLLLQHLMGARGDVLVPTAWVARWLHLQASDFGIAYVWTAGSFDRGRVLAGCAVAVLALMGGVAGWFVISRAARS